MTLELNNQSAWGSCLPAEVESRKKLWWIIYFLDRRIAQRNRSPFLIRDINVAVEGFVSKAQEGRGTLPAGEPRNSSQSTSYNISLSYIQFLVEIGKILASIWDAFFAVGASKRGDSREVETTDAQILCVRRRLPLELTWNTELVETYVSNGETESQIRRRISIFLVRYPSEPVLVNTDIVTENQPPTDDDSAEHGHLRRTVWRSNTDVCPTC